MTFLDPSKFSITMKMTILSLLTAGLLAGCGIRGTLQTPPPLFGGAQKVDPERVPTGDLDDRDDTDEDSFDSLDHDPLNDF